MLQLDGDIREKGNLDDMFKSEVSFIDSALYPIMLTNESGAQSARMHEDENLSILYVLYAPVIALGIKKSNSI